MNIRDNAQYDLLKAELTLTQNQMDKYDQLSLTTKTWAVTLWVALSGWSFQFKQAHVVLISILVTLLFWFFDGYNKTYRTNYKRRRDDVQRALQTLSSGKKLPDAFKTPDLPAHDEKTPVRNMFLLHVGLPYIILVAVSLFVYIRL